MTCRAVTNQRIKAAAKIMRGYLEAMKGIDLCPTVHTIQGAVKDADVAAMEQIAGELLA